MRLKHLVLYSSSFKISDYILMFIQPVAAAAATTLPCNHYSNNSQWVREVARDADMLRAPSKPPSQYHIQVNA